MSHAPRFAIVWLLSSMAALPSSAVIAADDAASSFQIAQAPPPAEEKKRFRHREQAPPPAKQQPPQQAAPQVVQPAVDAQKEQVRQQQERKQQIEQQRAKQQERKQQIEQQRVKQQQDRQQQIEQQRAKQQQDRQQQIEQQRAKQQQDRQQQIEQQRVKQQQDRQLEERARRQPSPDAPPARQIPDGENARTGPETTDQDRPRRDVDRAGPRDDNRRRFERRENPSVANPPPSRDTEPAVLPPPTRDVDRAGPRDDNRRRFERRENPSVANPPPSRDTQPAGLPAVRPPPVREEARRAVGRETIRESYRRAPGRQQSFDDLKRNRRERTISAGKLRVIEEPDRRVIVKQNNRTFIRHDESERFRRIAPDARTIRRADGTSTTFMTRSGGVRIYDVTDRNGRLLHRYRRYPNGREVILIDNRRHYNRDKNRTRDVLIGAGIGLFIGSAIALAAPDVRIPRDEYIVDYGRASDDDLYDALTAPPIERLERGYSLDEIRYSAPLRDRMRRIDLDTVTFDFGSWEVGPDQGRALDRLADGINRVLQRNPDEIFMIEGHTDAVGSEEDNLTLSDRRAQSVAEILTTEYGVAPENLITQGYGEEHLKIPTDGPERLNRRIAVRRIGPLLSGRFEDERYSGAQPVDDRADDRGRGYEDLDDGPPDDGLPAVVPPDDGRTYDYDNDRYR